MTTCHTKQDNFLLSLWQRTTKACCNGTEEDEYGNLHQYYQMCQSCYERTAKACLMAAHVFRRAKLPHHASMCSKISTLAQKKMRLADRYRRQMASLLSFGDNAIFHMDWHLSRVAALDTSRDELITSQGFLEAELYAMLQINLWTQEQEEDYFYEE